MHQAAGSCWTRPEARARDVVVSRPNFSLACYRSLPSVVRLGRAQLPRSPQRLHVSCPAVEPDTEVPSTAGRPHTDSDLIQALFTNEPPTVTEPKPSVTKELNGRIKAAGSLPQLCGLVQQEAQNFDHVTTSHALHRLSIMANSYFTQLQSAHLASRESQQLAWLEYVEPTLQMLGQLLLRHMESCDPWAVSISFWAYGNLQYTDESVLAALCERGLQTMHGFTALDCASSLVGIAKLRVRPRCQREFVDHLLSHTYEMLSQVDSWGSQEVANVVWAMSRMGAAGPSRRALMEGLLEMTLWRLDDFSVQELAIIMYSCGRLRMRLPMQLVRITNHLASHLGQLNPQDAANVLWACAKLDFKPGPELLERLPHVMVDRLAEFKPQEVCNLLYGYGHLRYEHTLLLEGVAGACTPRLAEFSTQDLCLTLWSYGMLRYCPADTALFDTACAVLLQRANRLLPMELVMAVKGFARAGYQPPPEFMQQIAALSILKLHQFKPIEWAQLLWSYAQVGYRDVALFEAVVSHTIYMLQTWSRRLPKTTVDTILLSCERVGFWPQMLVDVAEMRGLYLKTSKSRTAEMEVLLPLGSQPGAGGSGDDAAAAPADAADGEPSSSSSSSSSTTTSSSWLEGGGSSDAAVAGAGSVGSSSSSGRRLFSVEGLAAPAWQQGQGQEPSGMLLWEEQSSQQQQEQEQQQQQPEASAQPPQSWGTNGNSSSSSSSRRRRNGELQPLEPPQQLHLPVKSRELQPTHLQQPPKRVVQPPPLPQQPKQHRAPPVIISAVPPLAAAGATHRPGDSAAQQQQQQVLHALSSSGSSSSRHRDANGVFLQQQ